MIYSNEHHHDIICIIIDIYIAHYLVIGLDSSVICVHRTYISFSHFEVPSSLVLSVRFSYDDPDIYGPNHVSVLNFLGQFHSKIQDGLLKYILDFFNVEFSCMVPGYLQQFIARYVSLQYHHCRINLRTLDFQIFKSKGYVQRPRDTENSQF